MSADWATETAFGLLRDSTSKPSGLTTAHIRLNEQLPNEVEELPLVGVFFVVDRASDQAAEGMGNREVVVQVEIQAVIETGQDSLSATKPFRAWACKTLLPNLALETGIEGAELATFKSFGVAGRDRLAGALLEFTIPYFFDPENA